jgi:hypothetical protein
LYEHFGEILAFLTAFMRLELNFVVNGVGVAKYDVDGCGGMGKGWGC